MPKDDLTGRTFGRLTIESFSGYPKPGKAQWVCRCSCGTVGLVVYGYNLKNGNTVGCGCVKIERTKQVNSTHRESRTAIYGIYSTMLSRCYSLTNKRYKLYGGRGVRVCDRWRGEAGFLNFKVDMGARPSNKYSIDRINNDGHYEPGNCRWATQKEQTRNTRKNHIIEGVSAVEFCEQHKLPYNRTLWRIKQKWSMHDVINQPHYVRR